MIWVAADYKAQCAIAGRGGVKGRSADHQYCIRCDDCLGDRHIMFEMWMTGEGETIASLALHCGGFPEDVWAINVADHPEHKSTRAEKGLCQNTGLGGTTSLTTTTFGLRMASNYVVEMMEHHQITQARLRANAPSVLFLLGFGYVCSGK